MYHIQPFFQEVFLSSAASLFLGWIADHLWGDPECLPHPVVGYGKLISQGEGWLNHGSHRFLKGALLAIFLVLLVFFVSRVLLYSVLLPHAPLAYFVLSVVLIFYSLSGTTLVKEVRQVFLALDVSLEDGRRQVGRIVGRDVSQLSAQEVRQAALETLAENLSDGVVAPLFWLVLLGVPGMLAYKMVNTLDSMIGYHSERYLYFGRFAARLDDVANYIPARLTALFMVIASGRLSLLRFVARYGHCHASPNSGYPESALAGILDCRFGGTHSYFGQTFYKPYIGCNERELTTDHMRRAICNFRLAEALAVVLSALLLLFF